MLGIRDRNIFTTGHYLGYHDGGDLHFSFVNVIRVHSKKKKKEERVKKE